MLPRLLLCFCLIFTCQGDMNSLDADIIAMDSLDAGNNSEDVDDQMYNSALSDDEIDDLMYNPDLFEGDIILDPVDSESRNIIKNNKWDNGIVFYTLDWRMSRGQKQLVLNAMKYLQDRTCLRFQERTNEWYYRSIELVGAGGGCSSSVGQNRGRSLRLEPACFDLGTIIHELIHTIGIFHEQSRFDRDEYVDILWQNIAELRNHHNFDKHPLSWTSLMNSTYDCDSIMHYSQKAFGRKVSRWNTLQTIRPRNPPGCSSCNPQRRSRPTAKDLQKINTLYQCAGYDQVPKCEVTDYYGPPNIAGLNPFGKSCWGLKEEGYCTKYGCYMSEHCKQTCRWCDYQLDNCQDSWPTSSWCGRDYVNESTCKGGWVRTDCRKSCGLCGREFRGN